MPRSKLTWQHPAYDRFYLIYLLWGGDKLYMVSGTESLFQSQRISNSSHSNMFQHIFNSPHTFQVPGLLSYRPRRQPLP